MSNHLILMVKGHRIKRKVKISDFLDLINNYSRENINCTEHTFFRLSEKQRKIFKCDSIEDYLLEKTPHLIGIQYNGCYAVFYKHKNKNFIRIIADIKISKIEVVTFYIIDQSQLPIIK